MSLLVPAAVGSKPICDVRSGRCRGVTGAPSRTRGCGNGGRRGWGDPPDERLPYGDALYASGWSLFHAIAQSRLQLVATNASVTLGGGRNRRRRGRSGGCTRPSPRRYRGGRGFLATTPTGGAYALDTGNGGVHPVWAERRARRLPAAAAVGDGDALPAAGVTADAAGPEGSGAAAAPRARRRSPLSRRAVVAGAPPRGPPGWRCAPPRRCRAPFAPRASRGAARHQACLPSGTRVSTMGGGSFPLPPRWGAPPPWRRPAPTPSRRRPPPLAVCTALPSPPPLARAAAPQRHGATARASRARAGAVGGTAPRWRRRPPPPLRRAGALHPPRGSCWPTAAAAAPGSARRVGGPPTTAGRAARADHVGRGGAAGHGRAGPSAGVGGTPFAIEPAGWRPCASSGPSPRGGEGGVALSVFHPCGMLSLLWPTPRPTDAHVPRYLPGPSRCRGPVLVVGTKPNGRRGPRVSRVTGVALATHPF